MLTYMYGYGNHYDSIVAMATILVVLIVVQVYSYCCNVIR